MDIRKGDEVRLEEGIQRESLPTERQLRCISCSFQARFILKSDMISPIMMNGFHYV